MGQQQDINAQELEKWQKILPGVPAEQIVIPKYHAKQFFFFPSPARRDESFWERYLRGWIFQAVTLTMPLGRGEGRNPTLRRLMRNICTRATRWWDKLDSPSPLQLNQELFVRRDKWENIYDQRELIICWGFCVTYLLDPNRNTRSTKDRIMTLVNETIVLWETGYVVELFSGKVSKATHS